MSREPDWNTIESELPGLGVFSVALVGEGWTARAYRVNGELLFKVPKRSEEWEELDREIAFLAFARPFLPVPVAEHLYQMRNSNGAPHGYAVYRYIPGQALCVRGLSDTARSAVATTLAHFLRAVHEMRPSPELEPILRREEERTLSEGYLREAREKIAPRLTGRERRCLSNLFIRHLDDAQNFCLDPRVVHADLSAQHILYLDGSVTGILDWGDVCLGDPDYDFSYLYADVGEAFVRQVASRYGHRDPDRLVRKARYFTVVDQIDTIVFGSGRAVAGEEASAWHRLRALLRETDEA